MGWEHANAPHRPLQKDSSIVATPLPDYVSIYASFIHVSCTKFIRTFSASKVYYLQRESASMQATSIYTTPISSATIDPRLGKESPGLPVSVLLRLHLNGRGLASL